MSLSVYMLVIYSNFHSSVSVDLLSPFSHNEGIYTRAVLKYIHDICLQVNSTASQESKGRGKGSEILLHFKNFFYLSLLAILREAT